MVQILQRTPNRLVVVEYGGGVLFFFGILLFFIGILLLGIFPFLAYGAGTTKLTCQRLSEQVVTCQKRQSHFFGFIQGNPVFIPQVTGAKLLEEVSEDEDGDTVTTYEAVLVADRGNKFPILKSYGYAEKAKLVDEVNAFIKSSNPSVTLHYTNNFPLDYIAIVAILVIAGVLLVNSEVSFNYFVFDSTRNQLSIVSSTFYLCRLQKSELQKQYPLSEIESVNVIESANVIEKKNNEEDEGEDAHYDAMIFFKSGGSLKLNVISRSANELESVCQAIREFLERAVPQRLDSHRQTESPKSSLTVGQSAQAIKSSLVFIGKQGTYSMQNRSAETIPASQYPYHQELLDLGFKFLGDLRNPQRSMILWCYAHNEARTYALLYENSSSMTPRLDLYSEFSNGASLITSTASSWIKDIPERKIYRSFYPGASVQELYSHHCRRMVILDSNFGRARPTSHRLRDLAASIDNYLSRELSGVGPVLLFYLRLIVLWLMTGRTS